MTTKQSDYKDIILKAFDEMIESQERRAKTFKREINDFTKMLINLKKIEWNENNFKQLVFIHKGSDDVNEIKELAKLNNYFVILEAI